MTQYYTPRGARNWLVICTTAEWTESEWHEFSDVAEMTAFMTARADEMEDREFTVIPPSISPEQAAAIDLAISEQPWN